MSTHTWMCNSLASSTGWKASQQDEMMIKKGAVLRLFFLSAVLNVATANLLDTLFGLVGDSPIDSELEKLTGIVEFIQFYARSLSNSVKLKNKQTESCF
jgi:hypothetical protein